MPTKPDMMSDLGNEELLTEVTKWLSADLFRICKPARAEILGRMAAGREGRLYLCEVCLEKFLFQYVPDDGDGPNVCPYCYSPGAVKLLAQPLPSETEPRSEK